ncbi:MAG: hypothetical protein FWD68_18150 [Alphaproteobacteria bacterium]|nr:hypothetical protein [Alphaproteobacteria bacterium]
MLGWRLSRSVATARIFWKFSFEGLNVHENGAGFLVTGNGNRLTVRCGKDVACVLLQFGGWD